MESPRSVIQFAMWVINKHGPLAMIALAATIFLGWLYATTLQGMSFDLRDHIRQSSWYQYQSCLSLATLAGSAPEHCMVPEDHEYQRGR